MLGMYCQKLQRGYIFFGLKALFFGLKNVVKSKCKILKEDGQLFAIHATRYLNYE